MFESFSLKKYNMRLVIYVVLISIMGVFLISSATDKFSPQVTKQSLGILVSLLVMFFISLIRYDKILNWSIYIYIVSAVMLLLVLLFGINPEGAGAQRWIHIPIIGRIQPSEFIKIAMIIFFAWFLSKYQEKINDWKTVLLIGVLVGVISMLILAEPDLSTTIVFIIVTLTMIFVANISYRWIVGALVVVIPLAITFIYMLQYEMIPFLRGYQARRILAWINPEKYSDANLQQANSIMAIGSGKMYGKGLNTTLTTSVKNGNFLSQEQTDFIFAIVGEELGFIGAVILIALFVFIVIECLNMANKINDMSGKLICVGVASLIGFQSFTNIAVATGLFPNTGLPLPFVSYGVSSLFSMYIGIGLVLNVGMTSK